jgi:DNA repair exonuclease SbcCD ATPase subunit
MSEVDRARRARERGDGRTWRERALAAEAERDEAQNALAERHNTVARLMQSNRSLMQHRAIIQGVIERAETAEARLDKALSALREAPMPARESIIRDEKWDEHYGEWWHARASDAAIAEIEGEADTARNEASEWADLCNYGWTIICNVSEGDWTKQSTEWHQAAGRFRDQYHGLLGKYKPVEESPSLADRTAAHE